MHGIAFGAIRGAGRTLQAGERGREQGGGGRRSARAARAQTVIAWGGARIMARTI